MKSRWYKNAAIYQIYPRSFCDSNGDGIGDIQGIISKLDYLKELGIDAVWLSPCYKSPNFDNGYDISGYKEINPEFGTMEDWQEMIDGMHKRGIKLIMDLVVNHTSDQHDWFIQSKSSKDNPYRDYYIWKPGRGKNGKKPPNNWQGNFLGSAWKYDETTNEYYLHLFTKQQPDLNWDNPKVRQEVIDICNFWFEKGVDGFRCDVITYISKEDFSNSSLFNIPRGSDKYVIGPNWTKFINEVNQKSWSKYDSMIVGECAGVDFERTCIIADENKDLLDTLFSFEHMFVDAAFKFKLSKFKKILSKYQQVPKSVWPSNYLENHDQPRCLPRYCNDLKYRNEASKMLATVTFMLRGTPYIYQGQEIGMTSCHFEEEEYKDVMSVNVIKMLNKHKALKKFGMKVLAKKARDNARTPMQWNGEKGAGFTAGEPWMKINPNYVDINVEKDQQDKDSIFKYYKELIQVRKSVNDIISDGEWIEYYPKSNQVYVFARKLEDKYVYVEANFSNMNIEINRVQTMNVDDAKLIISNYEDNQKTTLRPFEVKVYSNK